MPTRSPWWASLARPWTSLVLPLALVAAILVADELEGPKTAYVGVLVAVPMLSAVFGSPLTAVVTGASALVAAGLYGLQADDGQVTAQLARLVVIAVLTVFAAGAAGQRLRSERRLVRASQVVAAMTDAVIRPLPPRVGGLEVTARYVGADAEAGVGGDFYEVLDTRFGVRVVLGDVRGKGLAAVRLANYTLGAFRDAARREADLREVVRALEVLVATEGGAEDFVTAVVLEVSPAGVRGVTCGHPQPQVLAGVGAREGTLPVDVPLGLGAGTVAPRPLRLGGPVRPHALLLHSDGVTEARARDGSFLDLPAALRPTAPLPGDVVLDSLLAAVRSHAAGRLRDDVAMLWLEVPRGPGAGEPGEEAGAAAERAVPSQPAADARS